MIRKFLVTDPRKIVPKHSASLDRDKSIDIHADHMGITKFLSDQDPDYRNVLSELRRFVQPYEEQMKAKLPLVTSVSLETQGQSYRGVGNESSLRKERDQNTVREENSGGGSMTF